MQTSLCNVGGTARVSQDLSFALLLILFYMWWCFSLLLLRALTDKNVMTKMPISTLHNCCSYCAYLYIYIYIYTDIFQTMMSWLIRLFWQTTTDVHRPPLDKDVKTNILTLTLHSYVQKHHTHKDVMTNILILTLTLHSYVQKHTDKDVMTNKVTCLFWHSTTAVHNVHRHLPDKDAMTNMFILTLHNYV